jgi:hypothetical protein
MNAAIRIVLAYAIGGLIGFALYIATFALPIGGEILFYRGLLLALVTAAAVGGTLIGARSRVRIDLSTGIGIVMTGLAFNVCFLVLFPVTIDRSISVFLLSRIADEQPLTTPALQQRFADEYLGRMDQIPRRVREQALSGNIALDRNGAIRLTDRGRTFLVLAKAASGWFRTDPRFVDSAASSRRNDRSIGQSGLGK